VQKLDVALAEATTSSLEALQAYSLGVKAADEKGPAAARPYLQRAIELDPNFALGYWAVGGQYASLGELARASEYYAKAFQLREHTSEWERLSIAASYYQNCLPVATSKKRPATRKRCPCVLLAVNFDSVAGLRSSPYLVADI
jgi:tetratricopeptide (TPR) repeat protein